MSDYHANFPIGTRVQAVWSEDGEWYVKNKIKSRCLNFIEIAIIFFFFFYHLFYLFFPVFD
jgi:uncharacterized membrane protein